jgi:G3E family GTPase
MTGFLIGDKITLLNRILENKQNLRVAALANKFSNNGQFTTIRYS